MYNGFNLVCKSDLVAFDAILMICFIITKIYQMITQEICQKKNNTHQAIEAHYENIKYFSCQKYTCHS